MKSFYKLKSKTIQVKLLWISINCCCSLSFSCALFFLPTAIDSWKDCMEGKEEDWKNIFLSLSLYLSIYLPTYLSITHEYTFTHTHTRSSRTKLHHILTVGKFFPIKILISQGEDIYGRGEGALIEKRCWYMIRSNLLWYFFLLCARRQSWRNIAMLWLSVLAATVV